MKELKSEHGGAREGAGRKPVAEKTVMKSVKLTPELWEPSPGMTTGIILPPDDGPVYVTGLGDALIRLKR